MNTSAIRRSETIDGISSAQFSVCTFRYTPSGRSVLFVCHEPTIYLLINEDSSTFPSEGRAASIFLRNGRAMK